MRLCCACLMVITIFGALPQMKTGMDWSFPQKETMEQAVKLRVPLVADVHTGTNWAETK